MFKFKFGSSEITMRNRNSRSLKSVRQDMIPKKSSAIVVGNLSAPVLLENNMHEQWAHTHSTLYNVNFRWSIDNFSFRQEKTGQRLESPTFSSEANNSIKWRLLLYPNGELEDEKDYLSIFLQLVSGLCPYSKIIAKFKFSILNTESHKPYKVNSWEARRFVDSAKNWGYKKFFKRSVVLNEANGYLPDDKLTILCVLGYVTDSVDISSQKSFETYQLTKCKITNDLANMLESQEFSDVKIISGEHEFPAHKAILAARSEVFAAMFKHDMEERSSGRITITDVNHDVLKEMLHFIYTDECTKLKELTAPLLAAADKYALKKLKLMCEQALFDKLSLETAIETLVVADLHSAEQLKKHTIQFITTHAKYIIETEEWKNMKNSKDHLALIAEISEAFLQQPK